MKTIQPSEEYIFAEPIEVKKKTDSGILLQTAENKDEERMLKAINIGKGVEGVAPGDIILYIKTMTGSNIKLNNKEYVLVHKSQLLGVVKEVEDE